MSLSFIFCFGNYRFKNSLIYFKLIFIINFYKLVQFYKMLVVIYNMAHNNRNNLYNLSSLGVLNHFQVNEIILRPKSLSTSHLK